MRNYILAIIIFFILLFSSCNSYKRINYINPDETGMDSLYQKIKKPYHLQPGDILYIRIKTPNQDTDRLFNKMSTESGGMGGGSMSGPHIQGYPISDSGYIEMPVVGEVFITGLTISDAKDVIYSHVEDYIKEFDIEVKLFTFSFVVLGEVGSPGNYSAQTEEMNILEAIAMAGEVNYSGRRDEIQLIRHTSRGVITKTIDLTDDDIMKTEDYYIQPNDILYVRPMKITAYRERSDNTFTVIRDILSVLSFLTTTLTALALIKSL